MALGKVGGNQLETTLNIDSGTLYVDGTNNRVGINTQSPGSTLEVAGAIQATGNAITVSDAGFNSRINLFNTGSGGSNFSLYSTMSSFGQGANTFMLYSPSATAGIIKATVGGHVTMPYQPGFYAKGPGSNTTLTNGADLNFSNALYNQGGHYNTSNYRFTAPVTGTYFVSYSLFVNTETGRISLKLNGGSFNGLQSNVGNHTSWASAVRLNANDYITVGDWQNLSAGVFYMEHSHFSAFLLG